MSVDSRLEALERDLPKEIVLLLDDGHTFHHPGPVFKFYAEAMKQIESNGPLVRACCRAVQSSDGSRLHEAVRALAEPLIEEKKHVKRSGSNRANRSDKTNGARAGKNRPKR